MMFNPDGEYRTKEYIEDFLSKSMDEIGFKYIGNNKWCSVWNGNMRKVISLFLLRGDRAIFEWGVNFDFLPEVKSGVLRYYRTDKSAAIQLREMPAEFIDFGEWKRYTIPMRTNDVEMLENNINEVWGETLPLIDQWYQRICSLEDVNIELERQIKHGKYYRTFLPEQAYVKAFVMSEEGYTADAIKLIRTTKTFIESTEELQMKILYKLNR